MSDETKDERLFPYVGDGRLRPLRLAGRFPEPPRWRDFSLPGDPPVADETPPKDASGDNVRRGSKLIVAAQVVDAVNAALVLRRPLLVTGKPGTGKSSLAYAVAHELDLGRVLVWPITSRSTLQQGLYNYDAIARLHEEERRKKLGQEESDVGLYLRLGALGTALLPARWPRVLLIDEVDKSDLDLPNDLLHAFEEGRFEIPEVARLPPRPVGSKLTVRCADADRRVEVPPEGVVRCRAFPFVVLTSNGERDFPPAFLRRCVRVRVPEPPPDQLARIVAERLEVPIGRKDDVQKLVEDFAKRRTGQADSERAELATDQLLNAAFVLLGGADDAEPRFRDLLLRSLSEADAEQPK